MARQLSAVAALPGDQISVPVPTRWVTPICNSNPSVSDTLCWPLRTLQACGAQMHVQAKSPCV